MSSFEPDEIIVHSNGEESDNSDELLISSPVPKVVKIERHNDVSAVKCSEEGPTVDGSNGIRSVE